MEDLIELYLFKNKQCPLPSLGVLKIIDCNAVAQFSEGRIDAPLPTIKLFETPMPSDDFIEFIAAKRNISAAESSALLKQYCNTLQNMDAYNEKKLPNAGKFYVNADGNLVFKTIELPKAFLPDISVQRVIHPTSSHAMVVGDKETTSTEMAAYYSDAEAMSKDRWWIWAAALAVVSSAVLFFYFNDKPDINHFGNTQKIEILPEAKTYSIAE